jgi:PAS domain S-box-containing protein
MKHASQYMNARPTAPLWNAPERRFARTLSSDLILRIILVVIGVFVMVASITYGYMIYKDRFARAEALQQFGEYLPDSLELPIWNFDEETIKKICGSFFENDLVGKLKVTDAKGNILFERYRIARDHKHEAQRKFAIMHAGNLLGHCEVGLNLQVFHENRRQLIWFSVSTLAAVVLILTITLRFVLKRFLLFPLNQLILRTEQISRGKYDFPDFSGPQQEIQTIVSRFNSMAERIQRRERSLKDVNRRLETKVAEQQATEAALLSSQEELDSIIRSTPDIIYRLDTMGRFTFVSDAIRRYGVTPESLMGKLFIDYVHEDDREHVVRRINERRTGDRRTRHLIVHAFGDYCLESANDRPTGDSDPIFLVDAEGLYVSGEAGVKVFIGTQGIARDITQQRKIECARMESEDRLLMALDASAAGIWELDLKTDGFRYDERIHAVLECEKADLDRGMDFFREKIDPETWDEMRQKLNRHVSGHAPMFDHEFTMQSKQGQWKWFHTKAKVVRHDKTGAPETMVGIIIDTSERKESEAERERLEMKLQHAQKMEAIGTLAGGIAHDFNNILGAIFGYTQLAGMQMPDDPKLKEYLSNIYKASERAKGLVDQILTFTRQGKSQKSACDIAIVIKEAVKLIRASIPSTVNIVQNIPTRLGTVVADQTQVHQVLMNLCTNASHAMDEQGGELTVTLERVSIDGGTWFSTDDLDPGPYLRLSVRDTGAGMQKSVADRIFEPYFTTKAVGEGTGMGLATVHGIVNDHGGRITVESSPGRGTVFRVLFPVLNDQAEDETVQSVSYPRGSERILFVDDEEILVTVGVEMLKDLGYDAVGTTRSVEALETFKKQPDSFDLVITDMTMPDLTGDQLATQILQCRPDIPVIVCSGFSKHMNSERVSALGIGAFLMKPVTVEQLSHTIREVLD